MGTENKPRVFDEAAFSRKQRYVYAFTAAVLIGAGADLYFTAKKEQATNPATTNAVTSVKPAFDVYPGFPAVIAVPRIQVEAQNIHAGDRNVLPSAVSPKSAFYEATPAAPKAKTEGKRPLPPGGPVVIEVVPSAP